MEHINKILTDIKEEGLFKSERTIITPQDVEIRTQNGTRVLNFCANNYLGLANHPDLINAGKQTITSLPGAVLFDSAISFSMIRGNHIHLSVLGAMQVAENGDIANWKIPGKMVKGMGGAMDLVTSSNNIIVAMTHTNRQGQSKLLKRCTLPITGVSCVKKIVTDLYNKNFSFSVRFLENEKLPDIKVERWFSPMDRTLRRELKPKIGQHWFNTCLLYTSDAADE